MTRFLGVCVAKCGGPMSHRKLFAKMTSIVPKVPCYFLTEAFPLFKQLSPSGPKNVLCFQDSIYILI